MGGIIKYFCFVAYALIKLVTGAIVNSFGPIILYYTKVTHQDQTYFSFIFFAKGLGYLTGGFLRLRAIGILLLVCLAPLILLDSVQKKKPTQENQQQNQRLQLPKEIEVKLCLTLLVLYGLITFYKSWIPTYAEKSGALNETESNALISIYWIISILAKTLMLFWNITVERRLYLQLGGLLIGGFIILILQFFSLYILVCYFGIVIFGFFVSGTYSLLFNIAPQHKYKLSPSNVSHLVISIYLGQNFLVTPIGYLIGLFGFKALIYSVVIFQFIMYALFSHTNTLMIQGQKKRQSEKQVSG